MKDERSDSEDSNDEQNIGGGDGRKDKWPLFLLLIWCPLSEKYNSEKQSSEDLKQRLYYGGQLNFSPLFFLLLYFFYLLVYYI